MNITLIKSSYNNFLFRLKLFFANKNNTELDSKIFINKIIEKIVSSSKPSYLPDGYRIYSQNDEDGIIAAIYKDIGIQNKCFIEIGVGRGIENNTHYLLLKDWHGIWIDSSRKNIKHLKKVLPQNNSKLGIFCKKINPLNINKIIETFIAQMNPDNKLNWSEIDFLSIDIDSLDIHCINSLSTIRPRVICIEYNSKFSPDINIGINKNTSKWEHDDYFGASLVYINKVMEGKNYKLISTNISGSNAFYVVEDLYSLCRTHGQSIKELYMPPNYNLFDYYVTHKPSLKFLIDKLKE